MQNMETALISPVDYYMSVLKNLTDNCKIELINRLSASLLKKEDPINDPNIDEIFANFSKDWGGDSNAIEIAENIRKSRINTRIVDVW